jgi:hypothetical protein
MQQNDEVVSGWLSGANSICGLDNPAGPLYLDTSTEKKMSSNMGAVQTVLKTTQSCASGCACC